MASASANARSYTLSVETTVNRSGDYTATRADVETDTDIEITTVLRDLGYTARKLSSAWTASGNANRPDKLTSRYEISGPAVSTLISFYNSFVPLYTSYLSNYGRVDTATASFQARAPGVVGLDDPSGTLSRGQGSFAATERVDVDPTPRPEGKLDPYHGPKPPTRVLDESTYESPAPQGSSNTPLIIAAMGIGGLLLWTVAESRKKGR